MSTMRTKNYFTKGTFPYSFNLKKLFTLMAVIAVTSFFTTSKAALVKDSVLAHYDFFTTALSFSTTKSVISGNEVGDPAVAVDGNGNSLGYMYCAASGSGSRGVMITNMTSDSILTDTIYYEFDWNPYKIDGQTSPTGTSGIEPAVYAGCVVRDNNDSIVFGLWADRWNLYPGSKYNVDSVNADPQGGIHLMNLSTDPYNPVPASIVFRSDGVTSYYTNLAAPFAMLDPDLGLYSIVKCDSINKSTNLGASFPVSTWYHVKAAIDFKNKRIISITVNQIDSTANTVTYTDLPFVNSGANNVARFESAGTRGKKELSTSNGNSCNYEEWYDNFDVYTVKNAQAEDVTIKYQDESGNQLQAPRVLPTQEVGTVVKATAEDEATIIIGGVDGDYYTFDPSSVDSLTVTAGVTNEIILKFIKATPATPVVTLSAPTSAEVNSDVPLSISVKTTGGDVVTSGDVIIMVNNIAKNRVSVDQLGLATLNFPNLLVGDENLSAVFIGDHINYLNSDTAKITVNMTPSTSSVKPYPVYFDLSDQPEIIAYNREINKISPAARPYSKDFADSTMSGIDLTDTVSTSTITYYAEGTTYSKVDNSYDRADEVIVPLGSGRPKSVTFKTPWINTGSYNIYISSRFSGDARLNIDSVAMDGKGAYFPAEEMYGHWFRSWNSNNVSRQWSAIGGTSNLHMSYIGSVKLDNSGTHKLRIGVRDENGANVTLDMLEFIPVAQDSLNINDTASIDMGKIYFPLFSWCGFAYTDPNNYDPSVVATSYADFTNFAPAYQVPDPTDWGTKYSYTIDSMDIDTVMLAGQAYYANYVIVYRAEDQWTRVSEGYSSDGATYTCDLPAGNYYYETMNYTDLYDGSVGYRTYVKSGYFSLPVSGTKIVNSTNIKAYAYDGALNVKGIQAGARILVTDLTGRVLVNTMANSDVYTKALPQGIYLVKVVSNGGILRTKVLVQ